MMIKKAHILEQIMMKNKDFDINQDEKDNKCMKMGIDID